MTDRSESLDLSSPQQVLPSLREQESPSFRALLKAQLGTGRGVGIHNFKV